METGIEFFLHLVAMERILVVFLRIQRKSTREDCRAHHRHTLQCPTVEKIEVGEVQENLMKEHLPVEAAVRGEAAAHARRMGERGAQTPPDIRMTRAGAVHCA